MLDTYYTAYYLTRMAYRFRGIPADFGARITASREAEAHYLRHVAPIVAWALAEHDGDRRAASDFCDRLRFDESTSDSGFSLLGRAAIALKFGC